MYDETTPRAAMFAAHDEAMMFRAVAEASAAELHRSVGELADAGGISIAAVITLMEGTQEVSKSEAIADESEHKALALTLAFLRFRRGAAAEGQPTAYEAETLALTRLKLRMRASQMAGMIAQMSEELDRLAEMMGDS